MNSTPPSRPSSGHDSAATEGTNFEDVDVDTPARGRVNRADVTSLKSVRSTKSFTKDGKGNVLVSVRVRPDGTGNVATNLADGWTVDGKRAAIGYKGREGGNFRYGEPRHAVRDCNHH